MGIPDYNDLYSLYDDEQERQLQKLPVCCWCGERIQTEKLFEICGDIVCTKCVKDCEKWTDSYIKE